MSNDATRLLILADQFQVRGSSLYTLRTADAFRDYELETAIVTTDARAVPPELKLRLQIFEYPHLEIPVWNRVVRKLLLGELQKLPPSLIHVQSRSLLPLGMWLSRKLGVPYILTVHDVLRGKVRLPIDRTLCRKIICVSESVRQEVLRRTGCPESLTTTIHTGIPTRAESDPPLPPVLDPGHVPVIGTAGRLESIKGMQYFLDAAAQVLRERFDPEFVIAGAGPQEANLRQLARQLGISAKVTFIPNLLEFRVAIEAMDIFCLPSLSQGLGTIMMEAMNFGKPVIATRVGGVGTVIEEDKNGLLISRSNSGELADRILGLLEDPMRARRLGEAGRRTVREKFPLETTIRETLAVYAEILEKPTIDARKQEQVPVEV